MAKLKYFLLTTIILLGITKLYSAEEEKYYINSFKLHIRVSEMKESESPFIFGENIVFSYKPSKKNVRHVGISFLNEDFSKIYNLHRNENGVYFYLYKYPKLNEVSYKFIEDGVWVNDKNNTLLSNNNFIKLSSFRIPKNNIKELDSPIVKNQKVTFKVREESGSSVYLTGDFNSWNPFLYPLDEVKEGIFTITLTLPKGKYGYYYISNGERKLDIENFNRGYSRLGEEVSIFSIE